MAQQQFRVSSEDGMWLRTEPVVSKSTEKVLLPKGQLVTKLGDSAKPDWWRVRTTFKGKVHEGFSNRKLMVADAAPAASTATATAEQVEELIRKTLAALKVAAPNAKEGYLQAIREGGPLFKQHGITTPQRMAHLLAQAMQETGSFTVLRESMKYSKVERIMEIFGVGQHSAKVTRDEAKRLVNKDRELAERVYGLGNPKKAEELGNTEPGDGFRYRGNGFIQMTGRGAHRKRGLANGLDFENQPELATLPEHVLKPALQEWTEGRLNEAADRNDIVRITKVINGGDNGLPERRQFFKRLLPLIENA